MASIKPIELYGRWAPNPFKVRMIFEELGIPHKITETGFADVKKPPYLAINPNGRIPAIYDPNEDFTLWESGAIIEYLIEKYDKDRKLSFEPGSKEAYLAKQWLYFQVSGQGPYYGQAVWFTKYHHEQLPSAQERYYKEIKRVTGVLEMHLKKQEKGADGPWLVGGKLSYVDVAFVPWQAHILKMEAVGDLSEFPEVSAWMKKLTSRPGIKKVLDDPMPS